MGSWSYRLGHTRRLCDQAVDRKRIFARFAAGVNGEFQNSLNLSDQTFDLVSCAENGHQLTVTRV
jgi:hypothetical protein